MLGFAFTTKSHKGIHKGQRKKLRIMSDTQIKSKSRFSTILSATL